MFSARIQDIYITVAEYVCQYVLLKLFDVISFFVCFQFLLDHGANKEAQTDDGWRPLHSASRWNQTEVISLLLQCGVNINAQTDGGHTALHLASTDKDNRDALEILLKDENIDTSIRNSMGETAYEICRRTSDNCLLFEEREKSINKQTES